MAGVFDPVGEAEDDRVIISGTKGVLSAPFFDPGPIKLKSSSQGEGGMEVEMTTPEYPHLAYFSAMAAHILDGAPAPVPATEAILATEIIRKLFAT